MFMMSAETWKEKINHRLPPWEVLSEKENEREIELDIFSTEYKNKFLFIYPKNLIESLNIISLKSNWFCDDIIYSISDEYVQFLVSFKGKNEPDSYLRVGFSKLNDHPDSIFSVNVPSKTEEGIFLINTIDRIKFWLENDPKWRLPIITGNFVIKEDNHIIRLRELAGK